MNTAKPIAGTGPTDSTDTPDPATGRGLGVADGIPAELTSAADWLLSTTRTVRKRLDLQRPVERETILECLRLAVQAPSGSNVQGWRWIVVTDAAKRARLAELYRAGGRAYMEHRIGQPAPDAQTARVRDSSAYLMEIIDQVPALVIPCIQGRLRSVESAASFFGSILPATWSFALALRARGLGSAWTTFHLAYEKEAAELLGIPENVTQAAMLPVAYTIGTQFRPATRPPVERITFWDSWGESG